ncbi:MAG: hypothetical protein ACK5ZC_13085 [Pirellulaceae bacterium]|jgi:hypothetical protein
MGTSVYDSGLSNGMTPARQMFFSWDAPSQPQSDHHRKSPSVIEVASAGEPNMVKIPPDALQSDAVRRFGSPEAPRRANGPVPISDLLLAVLARYGISAEEFFQGVASPAV